MSKYKNKQTILLSLYISSSDLSDNKGWYYIFTSGIFSRRGEQEGREGNYLSDSDI